MDLPNVGYIFEHDRAIWRITKLDNFKTEHRTRLWNVTIECLIELSTTGDCKLKRQKEHIFTSTDVDSNRITYDASISVFKRRPSLLRVCQLRQQLDELARSMAYGE